MGSYESTRKNRLPAEGRIFGRALDDVRNFAKSFRQQCGSTGDKVAMRTTLETGKNAAGQLAQADRDQMYQALPESGKRAQGGFALWAFGVPGVKREEVDGVIADERVQWELRQQPVDAVELMRAIESAAMKVGAYKIYDALRQPVEKLMLMSVVRGG